MGYNGVLPLDELMQDDPSEHISAEKVMKMSDNNKAFEIMQPALDFYQVVEG